MAFFFVLQTLNESIKGLFLLNFVWCFEIGTVYLSQHFDQPLVCKSIGIKGSFQAQDFNSYLNKVAKCTSDWSRKKSEIRNILKNNFKSSIQIDL